MSSKRKFRVEEATRKDAGRGIARLHPKAMKELDITVGDVVIIQGKRKTAAIVWPKTPLEDTTDTIRIDGITRRNAETAIDQFITVRKIEAKEARSVTLAPTSPIKLVDGTPFLKQNLIGRPITRGDRLRFQIFGKVVEYIITNIQPTTEAVIVQNNTNLIVRDRPTAQLEQQIPQVTYEDIGGLHDAIRKVRELVELPVRHPELFERLGIQPPTGILLYGPPGTGKTLLAKAVATETNATFYPISGPEIMSKFYGECVSEDALVLTNGNGLLPIADSISKGNIHSIASFDFDSGKIKMQPVKEIFDKGIQDTLDINTPHGRITATPTSRLLTITNGSPKWEYVKDLKVGDQIGSPCKIQITKTQTPQILSYIKDNTYLTGSIVQKLLSDVATNKTSNNVARNLGISDKKYSALKTFRNRIAAKYIKKLFAFNPKLPQDSFQLKHNRRIPLYGTSDLMYILGLLAGDGHLRYSPKRDTVTQIILTMSDQAVLEKYKTALKNTFNVTLKQYRNSKYGFYFNSRPIGDLLHRLGIPYARKSETVSVPSFVINLPDELLASYLAGLYDADGDVHRAYHPTDKSRMYLQVLYTTKSKTLAKGIRFCLLRFGILSTLTFIKKDQLWRIDISDSNSLTKFKQHISITHSQRRKRLEEYREPSYSRPSYSRIPVANWIYEIGKTKNITHRQLLRLGINPRNRDLTIAQLKKAYDLMNSKGVDKQHLDTIEKLLSYDVIWTPIREISKTKAHVFDFEVPTNHNFVADGIIVHNSEANLRKIFEEARENSPSIIFIDEIDALAPKREEAKGEVERRVVAQLLALMDGLESRGQVVVIGATNRPNDIDPALRRPGRFDREIEIPVPDNEGRLEILHVHTRGMPLADDVDLKRLASITHGFVGADLAALTKEAAIHTLRKILPKIDVEADTIPAEILDKLEVINEDFTNAMKEIEPSALREVIIERPTTKWGEVGGLNDAKKILRESVEWPLLYRGVYKELGFKATKGVLLYGPPGTGKTLLARAVAGESEANFISIKGPELLSKWVGESEKGVREIFKKAKQAAPAVIFFDEFDALATSRSSGATDSGVGNRVLSQVLTELDGLEKLRNVIVIAATNRPDLIDPALLRPGRLDQLVAVPLPDFEARKEILQIHTREANLGDDVNLDKIAKETENFSGADLEAITREAMMVALREFIQKYPDPLEAQKHVEELKVGQKFLQNALDHHKQRPTVAQVLKSKMEPSMLT